ncbi:MAG TPA: hypothetical protein DDW52_19275, partial [Planctomycetaceae bacterium]|nr:hypothetical protein [Planctomycetaceae bacterium]
MFKLPSFSRNPKEPKKNTQRRRDSRRRFRAELLESRNLLAAVAWDGGGDGTSFGDADNWSNDQVPGISDDVTIGNVDNTPFEVQLTSGATVNSLNLAYEDATLFVLGNRQLTINDSSTIDAGTLRLAGGAKVTGIGSLTNKDQIVVEGNSTRITTGSFIQQGTLDIGVEGGLATASLITGGFTNEGLLRLGSSTNTLTTLQSDAGAAVMNAAGAEIIVDASAGGKARILSNLENVGTLKVDADLTFDLTNAALINNGSIDVESHAQLKIGGNVNGVQFTQQGGQLNVEGEVLLQRIDAQLVGGAISSNDVAGSQVIVEDSDLTYGTNLVGESTLLGRRNNDLESNLPLGHTIRIQATNVDGRLTVPNDFVNEGTLSFEALDGSTRSTDLRTQTTDPGATILNAASGTITVLPGGTFTLSQGNLVNEGSFALERTTAIHGNQKITNRGDLTVGSNGDLTIQAFVSSPSLIQESGELDVQGSLTFISTDFDFIGGTISDGSNILVDGGDITLADGNANPFTFTVENGVEFFGDLQDSGQRIDVFARPGRSGRLIVEEGFVNEGTISFNSRDGALNTVDLQTASPSNTSEITNAVGGVIEVNGGVGLFQLLNVGNLINEGTFTLNRTSTIRGNQTIVNRGDLTVGEDADLTVQAFSSNPRLVQESGELDIQGTLTFSSTDFNFLGGTIVDGSSILVDGGDITISDGNTNPFTIQTENGVELFGNLQSPDQRIDVFAKPGRSGRLIVEEGFVNQGAISFNSRGGALNSVEFLTRSPSFSSVITNAPGGVVDVNAGLGLFQLLNVGNFVNQGEFTIGRDFTLRGTQTIENQAVFEIEAGTNVEVLRQFTADPAFRQSAGTLQIDGQLSMLSSRFEFDGGEIVGVPRLKSATLDIAEGNQDAAVFKVIDESFNTVTTQLFGDLSEGQTVIVETSGTGGSSSARLLVEDDFVNSGTIQLTFTSGVIGRSSVETSITGNFVNATTGVLTGVGEIQTNDLENQGTIAPGNGIGKLLIDANLNQTETAKIELELDGVTGTGFDELEIEHAFQVAGDLNLIPAVGFAPALGTTFQVITHAQVDGDFSFVNGTDLGNGTLLEKATLADQVRLLVRTPPELTVEDLTVTESDTGTVEAIVTVTLQETSNPVRVSFSTHAGSANPIEDFLDSNGQLEFAANETSKTVMVPIVGDLRDEDPETLSLTLSGALNAASSDPGGALTILDNGDPQPEIDVVISESDTQEAAGEIRIEVNLSRPSGVQVSVDFAVAGGTAAQGEDFTLAGGTLVFAPDQLSQTIVIPIVDDAVVEANETLHVELSNPVRATLVTQTSHTATIVNDDAPLVINPLADVIVEEDANELRISIIDVFNTNTAPFSVQSQDESLISATLDGTDIVLTFQPNKNGPTSITLTAGEPGLQAADVFEVTVTPVNDAPRVANPISDMTVDEDAADQIIDLSDVFGDIDSASLSLTAVSSDGSLVGTSITDDLLTLSFVPNQHGSAIVTVTADDGELTASDSFNVTINPVNDAPTVSNPISDITVDEDSADQTFDLRSVFEDIDSVDLLFSATSNDGSLVSTSVGGGLLTLSFASDQNGVATVTVTADDGELSVSDSFTVTVNAVNDAPIVVNPIADVTVDEDANDFTIDLSAVFSDIDSSNLTLSVSNSDTALVSTTLSDNILTLSFVEDQNGSATVTVTADDGDLTVSDTFNVVVNPVNDAPIVVSPIADISVDEDAADQTIDLTSVFTDVDSANLTLTALSSNATLVAATIVGDRLSLSFAENQNGDATVTVTASDGSLTVSDTFSVTVNAVNDSPILVNPIGDIEVDEDSADQTIDLSDVFVDIDSPSLTLSVESSDESLVSTSFSGSVLSLSFGADRNGTAIVTVVASDGERTASDAFDVTVNAVNDAPVVSNPLPDLTVDENSADQTIDLSGVFSDVDSANLTLTVTSSDASLVTPTLNGDLLTLELGADQVGVATITVVASDGELSAQDVFEVAINEVGGAEVVELSGGVLRITGDLGEDIRDRVLLNRAGPKIK